MQKLALNFLNNEMNRWNGQVSDTQKLRRKNEMLQWENKGGWGKLSFRVPDNEMLLNQILFNPLWIEKTFQQLAWGN